MKQATSEGAIQQAAFEYAGYGWKIVLLHAKAKRPRGEGWQHSATNDAEQLAELFEHTPDANIGLLLGPPGEASGVIDIEFDDDVGRAAAERLFGECYTPTYRSVRSVHRLFRWTPELPAIQKDEDAIKGLEIRIGGGGKAAQSVLPPSRHPTGSCYEWLPGLAPSEVELADVPDEILRLLSNTAHGDDKISESTKRARDILDETIEDGQRNDRLYRWAFERTGRMRNVNDLQEQSDLFTIVDAINQTRCRTPLPSQEVRTLVASAIDGRRREQSKVLASRAEGYTEHGLIYDEGEWFPGDWKLVVVLSDPPTYKLCVPAWKAYTHDRTGEVTIPARDFEDHAKVAAAVLHTTRMVLLNRSPGEWSAIWNGTKGTKARPATIGLHAKLMATCDTENPPPSSKRYVAVAEYLLEKIIDAQPGERPESMGYPVRIAPGGELQPGIWFRWKRVWQDGLMMRTIEKPECDALQNRLGLTRQDFVYFPHHGKPRLRFCVLKDSHLAILQGLTSDEDQLERPTASARNGQA